MPPVLPDSGPDGVAAGGFWCSFESKADNPHISSRNRNQVSAHGHWKYRSGTCRTATVTLWLYHRRWSPFRGHYWALTDTDIVRRMPRNARLSERANTRYTCGSQDRDVGFWAIVDVDIDGYIDGPDLGYSDQVNVRCVPW